MPRRSLTPQARTRSRPRSPTPPQPEQLTLFSAAGFAADIGMAPEPGLELGPEPGPEPTSELGSGPVPEPPAELAPAVAKERLFARLAPHFGDRLRHITLTSNRSRILSCAPGGDGRLRLRLDAAFAGAPEEVLIHVATWALQGGAARRRALAEIRAYLRTLPPRPLPPPRRVRLDTAGRAHDLRAIADEINEKYFAGRVTAPIGWGRRMPSRGAVSATGRGARAAWRALWRELRSTDGQGTGRRPRRKSIRLGSYSYRTGIIRIHRALDDASIPRYVVASVVHHEMLHADLPRPERGRERGRRRIHTPEFRRLEAQFEDHERAQRWLQENLGALLSC